MTLESPILYSPDTLLVHAGIEDPADLIAGLEAGFGRLAAADGGPA